MTNIELTNLKNQITHLVYKYGEIKLAKSIFVEGKSLIPATQKCLSSDEFVFMTKAILDGWLTAGKFNKLFESRLCSFVKTKHCLTVNSGSSANLVAFSTLTSPQLEERAIKKGDEVITVAAGFPTTINPIIQNGAIPVFVDIDPDTLNINIEDLEKAVNRKTKCIFLAHTLGNPFNVNVIRKLCSSHGLWLIEDCCDALGSKVDNKMVGTFGDLSTFSFYPAHHITTGEGGAIMTDNPLLHKIAMSIRDWGRDCYCPPGVDNTCGKRFNWTAAQIGGSLPNFYDHKYIYSNMGYNLKFTDIQAACGLSQISKLESFVTKRKLNFNLLEEGLSDLNNFFTVTKSLPESEPSWFGFPLTLDPKVPRYDLISYLEKNKIQTRTLFCGNVTRQPYMRHHEFKVFQSLANTDKVMNNTFWIGCHPNIDDRQIEYIVRKFKHFFQNL